MNIFQKKKICMFIKKQKFIKRSQNNYLFLKNYIEKTINFFKKNN